MLPDELHLPIVNSTSRSILQVILVSDNSLTADERFATQQLIDGKIDAGQPQLKNNEPFLITQRQAAHMLGVSRVTIWRMTKLSVLHPVEILPGAFRYSVRELKLLAERGLAGSARNT